MLQQPKESMRTTRRTAPPQSRRIGRVLGACLSWLSVACVSGGSKTAGSLPLGPAEDTQYFPVVQKWTRNVQVFSQFQNRIEMTAVLLPDEMRRAVAERLSRLRGHSDGLSVLSEAPGGVARLGLLVSVFTPETPYMNLDERSLWSLNLRIGAQQQQPMFVRRVADKTVLEPFFTHIHRWSQDYLLVFDFPETSLQRDSATQAQVSDAEFLAQSAIVRIEMRWP